MWRRREVKYPVHGLLDTRLLFSAKSAGSGVAGRSCARRHDRAREVTHAHRLPRFLSLHPRLEPLTVAPAQARFSTAGEAGCARPRASPAAALEAGVDPVVVAVITISVFVPVSIELVIGGRRRRVPVLEFYQANPNQIT